MRRLSFCRCAKHYGDDEKPHLYRYTSLKTCKLPPSGRLQAASTEVSEQTALTVGVVLTIMVLWSCASRVCRSRSTR
jgi:hypothetical protein